MYQIILKNKEQFQIYGLISSVLLIFTGFLHFLKPSIYNKYLGSTNPKILFLTTTLIGLGSFIYLIQRNHFLIFRSGNHKWVFLSFILAAILTVLVIIFVDMRGGYPKDINVALPEALLFYPTIGFFVEIIFHVLPLTLILLFSTLLFGDVLDNKRLLIIIFIVSLIEPIYQLIIVESTTRVKIYQFLHIFIINLIQLKLFQRYDFVSMYSFRFVYYLFWHIQWGYLRLKLIF